jgi:uncharacterized membrane protein
MGLALLILGLAIFLGAHVFTTLRDTRAELVKRLGPGPYKGLYSLVAAIGFVLIIVGFGQYRAGGWVDIWYPPPWTRHVAVLLVWPAFICVTAAYIRGNIARVLKHPMLVGIKLWAVAHLIANGDLGSIILFGSVLAWAVYDRILLKRRSDSGGPQIPYGGRTNDIIAVVVGTIIYLAFGLVLHPLWIGVPVFGSAEVVT